MSYGINLIILITVPAAIGMIVLAKPIVEIAFERGAFDTRATIMTSQALRLLLYRVYYSLQDTKTPMINEAIAVGINIVLNIILVQFIGHAGLALATSIATTIATIMLLYGLKKKIGSLGTKEYVKTFLKASLASIVMEIVAYLVYRGLYKFLGLSKLYNLISLLLAVGLAIIVYLVLCYVFKIEKVRDGVDKVINRLRNRSHS